MFRVDRLILIQGSLKPSEGLLDALEIGLLVVGDNFRKDC